jgi:hypothetical protein
MSKTTPDQASPVVSTAAEVATNKTVAAKPAVTKAVTAKPATKTSSVKPVAAKSVAKAAVSKVAAVKKVAAPKAAKIIKEKTPKLKMERDSFTMPKIEYAQFHVLKERLQKLGQPAKKSELLRAGIMQLTAMTDAALTAAMSKVPTIKTGRPKNK